MNPDVMFSSATDLWSTPQDFFDKLNGEFHFALAGGAILRMEGKSGNG